VSWPQALLVFIAGIAAGTINTVVGSGTLITFPVLLGIGLSPVSANVSNTLGLAPGSLVGAYGYRAELTGQRRRVIVLGSASLVLVIIGPRLSKRMARGNPDPAASISVGLWLATMGTGIYGGYFGAAQGVLLVGLLGVLLRESLQRVNAIKNVLAGLVNLVAAIIFMFTAHMNYQAAGLIAAGSILGGLLGARIGRRLPSPVLRSIIVVVGIVAIVKLLI
jgi:uncharacterized membrane protein YfcA